NTGDPLLETWQIAWIGHALLHAPLDLWQANTFWPLRDTLAFSDALVGYAPAALLAQASPQAALAVYNLLFIGVYALAFVGAYLLGRELGLAVPGAAAAGVAYAYAPWKLAQNHHLHVLSSGGIALALFLLVRGYRRRSPWLVLAGWMVASWQMTLGFTLGLQLTYVVLVLAAGAGVLVLRGALPRPDRRVVVTTVAGAVLFVSVSGLMARPYLRVLDAHPEIEQERTPAYVESFSPRLRSFLSAPAQSWLWGDVTHRARAPLPAPDEMALFPGLTIGVLALVGALGGVFPRRLRIGLVVAVAVFALLSLGVRDVSGLDRYATPYRLLYDFAPGWVGIRTPGRINVLTSLGLALLAGAGLCVVVRHLGSRGRVRAATAVGALAVAAILVEGLGPLEHPRAPQPPRAVLLADPPHLHLPTTFQSVYMYWSTAGFPATVNGFGAFDPVDSMRLREEVTGFPDRRSVTALRALGVRSVLLHVDQVAGTASEDAATKPIAGLWLDRDVIDDVIVFRLR
ncbi:MAG TPA: hypothetical protein VFV62_03370, partial [Gaiellaceae bacterium]|nr:hypothetical protein [Gaiellaceae bacterium]